MNTELLIDAINIITEKSQSSIEQAIRKDKPINQRLKFVSLYLNEMKSQIFEWISNVLNSGLNSKVLTKKLAELKISTDQELAKNRLHILLKRKLKKLKKQSFLHSVDSHDNFFQQQSKVQQLEKSVLHIEKDLNIEPEEDDNLAISSIIQKSRMFNFDQLAVKDEHNTSAISEYETFKFGLSERSEKSLSSQSKALQPIIHFADRAIQQFQLSQSFLKEKNVSQERKNMKQNEQKNIPEPVLVETGQKAQGQGLKQKIVQGVKLMKKKKKSVYSAMGQSGSMSKDDLLGNILEECLQNENK